MTDISNLVDNAKKNGLKLIPNPTHVKGGREYYLCDEGLSNRYGSFIELNRTQLEDGYLRAMPEILEATGKRYAWHPEELEILQQIKVDLKAGKPIIITADGTINEFVVQDGLYGRTPKLLSDKRMIRGLICYKPAQSERFLINCIKL